MAYGKDTMKKWNAFDWQSYKGWEDVHNYARRGHKNTKNFWEC